MRNSQHRTFVKLGINSVLPILGFVFHLNIIFFENRPDMVIFKFLHLTIKWELKNVMRKILP